MCCCGCGLVVLSQVRARRTTARLRKIKAAISRERADCAVLRRLMRRLRLLHGRALV